MNSKRYKLPNNSSPFKVLELTNHDILFSSPRYRLFFNKRDVCVIETYYEITLYDEFDKTRQTCVYYSILEDRNDNFYNEVLKPSKNISKTYKVSTNNLDLAYISIVTNVDELLLNFKSKEMWFTLGKQRVCGYFNEKVSKDISKDINFLTYSLS